MSTGPEYAVATYLNGTVAALDSGTSLFVGGMPEAAGTVETNAAAIMPTGGSAPLKFHGGATSGAEQYPTVQILVRGGKRDYSEAVTLARQIKAVLDYQPIPGYTSCRPEQPGPIYIGLDKDSHHVVSLNYRLLTDG